MTAIVPTSLSPSVRELDSPRVSSVSVLPAHSSQQWTPRPRHETSGWELAP